MRRAILPLVAVALVATSCHDDRTPFESDIALDTTAGGAFFSSTTGTPVLEDGPSWDDWKLSHPEQTWLEDGGSKYISFEPASNLGISPEFEPITHVRVTFELYLPMRFPVFGLPFSASTTILALLSHDPSAALPLETSNKLAINMHDGEHWRVHAVGIDQERGQTWSSRDQFMTPWIFEHGWNSVEWTVELNEQENGDSMQLRVGDKVYSWHDVEISPMHQPFRHVAVGPWEARRGDQHYAIKDLVVENLSEDDTVPPVDPPGDDTPPPPVDPPETHDGLAGGNVLTGFWDGWLARHSMGSKYTSESTYGTMANNTVAMTKMDLRTSGWFECDIYYDTEVHPGEGGGQHLIGVSSQSAKRSGPYDPLYDPINLDGWLRLDLGVRQNSLQGVIYQDSPDRKTFVTSQYEFHAWQEWDHLRVEWEQLGTQLTITVNGKRTTHEIEPGLNPIGNLLMIGNMDRNTGDRCRGGNDPCGTLGRIRYANFQWGRN